MNKKTKKKKHIFLKIIVVLLLMIFVVFLFSPLIVVKSLPFLIKHYLHYKLKIETVKYNPFKLNISIQGISVATEENEEFLTIQEIFVDLNLKKTLLLKPTISTFKVKSFSTFLIKTKRGYSLPISLVNKDQKMQSPTWLLSIFSIDEIDISDCNINVMEGKRQTPMLTQLNIFIPGVSTVTNTTEINPIISGKYLGKDFKLKGLTKFEKGKLTTNFDIKLKLQLSEVANIIPDIEGIKIVKGIVWADIKIEFISQKSKKPQLLLSGALDVENLNLIDTNAKIDFLSKVSGSLDVTQFDVFNNILEISSCKINRGILRLIVSNNKKECSIFFLDKKKTKLFNLFVKKINTTKFSIYVDNREQKAKYQFLNSSITLNDFSTINKQDCHFKLSTQTKHTKGVRSSGFFNLKNETYNFETLTFSKFDLKRESLTASIFNNISNCVITNFTGNFLIKKSKFSFGGKGNLAKFNIKEYFSLNNTQFDIQNMDIFKQAIFVNSIKINQGFIKFGDQYSIKNLKVTLPAKKNPYTITLPKEEKLISISQNLQLNQISGILLNKKKEFSFRLKSFLLNLQEIQYNTNISDFNIGKSSIEIENIELAEHTVPFLKLNNATLAVLRYQHKPLLLSIKSLDMKKPYIKAVVNKNRKLEIFPSFFGKTDGKSSMELEVDKIDIAEGHIDFTDHSLPEPFYARLNHISGTITNYPSTVYPEGNFSFSTKFNDRNDILLNGKIGKVIGIDGVCKTEYLSLPVLSPYMSEYLGYSISSGNLNLNAPFKLTDTQLSINFILTLLAPRFNKNEGNNSSIDIGKILTLMENRDGNITDIEIPISGDLKNPNVDFKKLFFQGLSKIVSNFAKVILQNFNNFQRDNIFEIIIFKPGTSTIVPKKNIFSKEMKENIQNKKKYFILEGYVDKAKDTPYLKEQLLNQKIKEFSMKPPVVGSEQEKEILIKIYTSYYKQIPSITFSNKDLSDRIKQSFSIKEFEYYALSFSRIAKIRNILMMDYKVDGNRISISEKLIFENPYISGMGNNMVAVISGKKL